ncbi:MAG TPA: ATP-binding protein [Rhizomicrobium sp.]|nr:ATP-binding protein [Rhizomicrobium sp.]
MKRHLRPRFGNAFYVAAITAACFLLLFGLATVLYGTRNYDRQITQDAVIQGRILASAVSAALAFDDRKTAQGYVDSLAFNPSVEAAAIYDQTGRQFVSYARRGGNAPPSHVPRNVTSLSKDRVRIVAAVTEKGRHLGSVYLERSVEPATRRFLRFGLIAILVSMSAIILAILAISQRALASANTELARRAGELSSANAELRVQIEEREKAEAALRQSQKMEAIGQLTGGVAHDFNNLLQIITGSLGSLRRRSAKWSLPPDITGDFDRFLDGAEEGARRAAALTRQLLAFSRRQPLQPETVDVNRLVARMTSLLTRTLGETIAIETVLASGLWRVLTDPNQLESAILNLAVNARDAMPKGGKLTIETANAHLDEGYVEPYEQLSAGQYVMIAVTDSGTGMDSSTVAQAFEPFFTTKAGGHGTGLGLSQVYGFIKQSGGHTKIYSEPGQGTTIKMYLPRTLIERASAYDHAAAPETHAAAAGGETILVVEDEEKVRAASVEMLEELGYRVLEASDGPSALRLLDEKPAVDLLFTDVVLPSGMNGRQLADKIRREMPAVKVLYTTGYARNAIVHHGRLDPGVELITKPFGHAELAAKIRAVLESTPDVHNQPAGL